MYFGDSYCDNEIKASLGKWGGVAGGPLPASFGHEETWRSSQGRPQVHPPELWCRRTEACSGHVLPLPRTSKAGWQGDAFLQPWIESRRLLDFGGLPRAEWAFYYRVTVTQSRNAPGSSSLAPNRQTRRNVLSKVWPMAGDFRF